MAAEQQRTIAELRRAMESVGPDGERRDGPPAGVASSDAGASKGREIDAELIGYDPSKSAPPGAPEPVPDDSDYRKAKARALNILAARDHSRRELAEKLARKEHLPETIERLLDKLEASGLLDDATFARAFARSKRETRALGKSSLGMELRRKGVSDAIVEEVLAGIDDEDEIAAARVLALKRARTTRNLERDVRLRRIVAMLARRGYRSSMAYAVVTEVLDHEDD